MTTEEKRVVLDDFCDDREACTGCPLSVPELKCGRGEHFLLRDCRMSDADIELAYSIAFPNRMTIAEEKSGLQEAVKKIQECGIKDSGNRRQFASGAVRDIQEGKGRCDLLPMDVVGLCMVDPCCGHISLFQATGNYYHLVEMLADCHHRAGFADIHTMFLEVAKHFEEGCKKYGENNWQKGIPTHCYIDSAVRHYLKWLRGDRDEPHDRAFCWNILCCIWTCTHKPELNDYAKKDGDQNAED